MKYIQKGQNNLMRRAGLEKGKKAALIAALK
jgi:hypothetical protein